ncbi:hypothetical protein [Komagataeibacter xylinus]|uniref:Uncharacterized protein n=1 Tax=Komagataeibacter xylinus TaxID=28448 RepID=A0A857FK51_KOMXY|nr:hypothetical protein [Komagataeibacter xylinus]QHC34603.1 hypothetical protein FMA36_02960 [Komagataeibacter xylinus]
MTNTPADEWFARPLEDELQIWKFTNSRALLMGRANTENGPGNCFHAKSGGTVWDAIREETPWLDGLEAPGPFVPLRHSPGQFFPRMACPIIGGLLDKFCTVQARLPDCNNEQRYFRSAQTQLEALVSDLAAICRVVEPSKATLEVYGHEIRNLLILAATEVEMHMAGIMVSNGNKDERKNTLSYIKLAEPLRLRSYSVRFKRYPEVDEIKPFAEWLRDKPTVSLKWYDAYNAVKHDREGQFKRASLCNAIEAVAACAILLVAQCGEAGLSDDLKRSITVEGEPWPIEDCYVVPQQSTTWTPINHPNLR